MTRKLIALPPLLLPHLTACLALSSVIPGTLRRWLYVVWFYGYSADTVVIHRSVSATVTAISEPSVSAVVSVTAITGLQLRRHFRLRSVSVSMMKEMLLLQVLAARLMQVIVPSVENTKDLDAAEELVGELFKALGATLMTCRNDPTLTYSGTYFMFNVSSAVVLIIAVSKCAYTRHAWAKSHSVPSHSTPKTSSVVTWTHPRIRLAVEV